MEHILSLDFEILNWIAEHVQSNQMDEIMPFISWLGNSGMIFIVLGFVLLCFKKQRSTGVQILLALLFSLLFCNVLLKNIVERVRPFDLVSGIELLVKTPHDFSFPSGHTSAAFATATVMLLTRSRSKYLFLGFAILMGFSRLYLYVHYPSDVIGGVMTGLASGYFATSMYHWIAKRRDPSQGGM